jgi:aminopeptidase N
VASNANIIRKLTIFSCLVVITACSSITPLDPIIGDTGQPFSDIANSTDVISYGLDLEVFPQSKSIAGVGSTQFLITQNTSQVELKLDSRFDISKIFVDEKIADFQRIRGIININLGNPRITGDTVKIEIHYSGKPHIALRAPWSGGFVWSETENGTPWIATAVQGEGCDLFWPCKDHFADKADSMEISLTVPKTVSAVTNGVLQSVININKHKHQYNWKLSVPASDYNIALNIGPFTRIQQSYNSVNDVSVPIEFWALNQNTNKAKALIKNDLLHQISFLRGYWAPTLGVIKS